MSAVLVAVGDVNTTAAECRWTMRSAQHAVTIMMEKDDDTHAHTSPIEDGDQGYGQIHVAEGGKKKEGEERKENMVLDLDLENDIADR